MIGIDGHVLGDKSGGNETYYRNICENLDSETGNDYILFCNPDFDIEQFHFPGKIVRFKSKNAFIRNFIEIPWLCIKYRLNAIHMQYFIPFFRPCPVIVTIHDICFEHFQNIFTTKDYWLQKHLIPYAAKKSKCILTVSEFSKQDIINRYHIPEHKVIVTPLGVSSIFHPLEGEKNFPNKALEKFHISGKYLLSVGNLQPRKNIKNLLKAFTEIADNPEMKDFSLVIVGKKAWMYEELFQDIQNSPIKNRVILTDYVTTQELSTLYQFADSFIYPSLFEGFGLPPLEAMACGTPVAASNVSSIPEVTRDAAILFDPNSIEQIKKAILSLSTNIELRKQCRNKGLERAKNFQWKETAETVKRAYALFK